MAHAAEQWIIHYLHGYLSGPKTQETHRLQSLKGFPRGKFGLELRNGSRILSLPGGTDGKTIRGIVGVSLAIFDEAARCPDELFAAVRPMLATKNGSLILLSTPAGKRGQFYEIWHNGDPAWARIRVSADQCPRISAEFLAEERRELGEARFAEEYQLAFLDSNEAAFSTAIIDAALSHEVRPLWG